MTNEPLAVVAALQPSSTVYDRASRLTHRPLWVFTVSFAVSAYFLMMAIFQLPNLYEESSAIMLTGLNAGITVLALGLLFGKMMSRRKMKKTAYERAVHRNGTFPTVYRFYEDAVETVSLRSRVMIPYSDVIAAVEDSYGFYISNGELVVMLPAAGLTAYDAAFIRDLLCQHLPAGVYRRHQAINARMPQPHAIPLYPEQPAAVTAPSGIRASVCADLYHLTVLGSADADAVDRAGSDHADVAVRYHRYGHSHPVVYRAVTADVVSVLPVRQAHRLADAIPDRHHGFAKWLAVIPP